LKTAAELFTLYKTVVLPSRLSNDTFITYQLDYYYFGLAVDQRDYTLLAKAHLERCTTGSVTICPAKVPSYHSQVLTCEARLFFQNSNSFKLCRKNLLLHYQTQLFYITGRSGRTTSRNHARSQYVAPGKWLDLTYCDARWKRSYTQRFRLPHRIPGDKDLPILSKTMELPLDASIPHLYLPDEFPAVASHEISRIEAAMPPETTGLDYVKARLVTPRHSFVATRCSTCIRNQYTRHENATGSDWPP